MKEAPPPDRLALAGAVLLPLALYGRGLLAGYADQDLKTLETVMVSSLPGLLRGDALPGGFTPLSRELWLWWWGKAVGLGALGFHLVATAVAGGAGVLIQRAVERGAGAKAGLLTVALLAAFAPLGTAWVSIAASRDLVALLFVALALHAWSTERWLLAGLACGLAALSRETALLLPFALALHDRVRDPGAARRDRARRLLPAFAGVTLASVWLFTAAGAPPAGWGSAPRSVVDFARAWMPPGALSGAVALLGRSPLWVLAVLALAIVAVPGGAAKPRPVPPRRGSPPAPAGVAPPVRRPDPGILALGAAFLLLGLVAVSFVPSPRGAEVFVIPALGASILLGVALARAPAGFARLVLALAAVAALGAHWGVSAGATARGQAGTPLTPVRELHAQAARTDPWIAALAPVCAGLRAAPRAFAVGVVPDSSLALALSSGVRAVCRAPTTVRFLAEMTPEDASSPFSVLRYEPRGRQFVLEPATPPIRALVGEGLLLYARYASAAACFVSAAAAMPLHPELAYPLVAALAAAGRTEEARERWREARERGAFAAPDTLARRLLTGTLASESDRRLAARLAAAVLADPLAAEPHLALGRHLLALGQGRSAAIELAVGSGISRRSQDLYWLARAYDVMGSTAEALETYRVALGGGLDSAAYAFARRRLVELLRTRPDLRPR